MCHSTAIRPHFYLTLFYRHKTYKTKLTLVFCSPEHITDSLSSLSFKTNTFPSIFKNKTQIHPNTPIFFSNFVIKLFFFFLFIFANKTNKENQKRLVLVYSSQIFKHISHSRSRLISTHISSDLTFVFHIPLNHLLSASFLRHIFQALPPFSNHSILNTSLMTHKRTYYSHTSKLSDDNHFGTLETTRIVNGGWKFLHRPSHFSDNESWSC